MGNWFTKDISRAMLPLCAIRARQPKSITGALVGLSIPEKKAQWRQRQGAGAPSFSSDFVVQTRLRPFFPVKIPAKIHKIHSSERECRQSLRWKTAKSSEAKATAPKASATAKLFSTPPSPDIRKFSP